MWIVIYTVGAETRKITVEAPNLYKVAKVAYSAIGRKVNITSINPA